MPTIQGAIQRAIRFIIFMPTIQAPTSPIPITTEERMIALQDNLRIAFQHMANQLTSINNRIDALFADVREIRHSQNSQLSSSDINVLFGLVDTLRNSNHTVSTSLREAIIQNARERLTSYPTDGNSEPGYVTSALTQPAYTGEMPRAEILNNPIIRGIDQRLREDSIRNEMEGGHSVGESVHPGALVFANQVNNRIVERITRTLSSESDSDPRPSEIQQQRPSEVRDILGAGIGFGPDNSTSQVAQQGNTMLTNVNHGNTPTSAISMEQLRSYAESNRARSGMSDPTHRAEVVDMTVGVQRSPRRQEQEIHELLRRQQPIITPVSNPDDRKIEPNL